MDAKKVTFGELYNLPNGAKFVVRIVPYDAVYPYEYVKINSVDAIIKGVIAKPIFEMKNPDCEASFFTATTSLEYIVDDPIDIYEEGEEDESPS